MVHRLITINVSPTIQAFVPLICFAIMEFHQVDRVVRQFGWPQSIPPNSINLDEVHIIYLQGKGILIGDNIIIDLSHYRIIVRPEKIK